MTRKSFRLTGGVGYCNAVRRSILSDVLTEAPCHVNIITNTSCFTDEYLAHRIGLIPFQRKGNGNTMNLNISGPISVRSTMLTGPAFEAVYDIEIARLSDSANTVHMVVHFDKQSSSKHARYSPSAGVGMRLEKDACAIEFESNDRRSPRELILEALDHTEARLQRALLELAKQPDEPPQSFC